MEHLSIELNSLCGSLVLTSYEAFNHDVINIITMYYTNTKLMSVDHWSLLGSEIDDTLSIVYHQDLYKLVPLGYMIKKVNPSHISLTSFLVSFCCAHIWYTLVGKDDN